MNGAVKGVCLLRGASLAVLCSTIVYKQLAPGKVRGFVGLCLCFVGASLLWRVRALRLRLLRLVPQKIEFQHEFQ